MGFSRQEYWGGLPLPSPGDLPNPGIKPGSPALQIDALSSEPPGKPSLPCSLATAMDLWEHLTQAEPIRIFPGIAVLLQRSLGRESGNACWWWPLFLPYMFCLQKVVSTTSRDGKWTEWALMPKSPSSSYAHSFPSSVSLKTPLLLKLIEAHFCCLQPNSCPVVGADIPIVQLSGAWEGWTW